MNIQVFKVIRYYFCKGMNVRFYLGRLLLPLQRSEYSEFLRSFVITFARNEYSGFFLGPSLLPLQRSDYSGVFKVIRYYLCKE